MTGKSICVECGKEYTPKGLDIFEKCQECIDALWGTGEVEEDEEEI